MQERGVAEDEEVAGREGGPEDDVVGIVEPVQGALGTATDLVDDIDDDVLLVVLVRTRDDGGAGAEES